MKKVVVFHIGRGGRFHNSGYKTCEGLFDSFDPEYFGIDTYSTFRNLDEVLESANISRDELYDFGFDYTLNAYNWDDDSKQLFNDLKLKHYEFDEDDNIIEDESITAEDLGEPILTGSSGNELCTIEELNSDSGSMDINGDYNTYYWCPISELNEREFEIMIRDLDTDEYKDEMVKNGTDEHVFDILNYFDRLNEYIDALQNCISFEEFISYGHFVETTEDDDEEDTVKINGKFYKED